MLANIDQGEGDQRGCNMVNIHNPLNVLLGTRLAVIAKVNKLF